MTASDDETAKIWNPITGDCTLTLRGHADSVASAVFSQGVGHVLTASYDGTAKLWTACGHLLLTLIGHTRAVYSAVYSNVDASVLTASADGTAKLWNGSGNLLQTFSGHNAGVASAVFSRDGALLLTPSYDQPAKVWDADTGECIKTFKANTITAVFACGDYGRLYGDYFAGGMWTGYP